MLTLSQLLNSNIFENENEPWIEVARNFISNEFTTPFIIPFDQINGNFLNDEVRYFVIVHRNTYHFRLTLRHKNGAIFSKRSQKQINYLT
jgi:hypothetical protein